MNVFIVYNFKKMGDQHENKLSRFLAPDKVIK